ncbi:MAG: hypothetical protein H7Z40_22530 [Phycisphaerae bacterium]|nr:hypothetical protein [Gemmatimonadaceae bacterium]
MRIVLQDSTQPRTDTATAATTMAPPPEMRLRQNVGYLQAVYVEVVVLFGGYWLLLHRRSARLRERQKSTRGGR